MTAITAARNFIQVEEVDFESGVSEGTFSRMGAAVNYLMERTFYKEAFTYDGYFNPISIVQGLGGIRYVERDCNILSYYMSIKNTGSAGENSFNVGIYNPDGAFVTNLFGATTGRLLVSGDNVDDVIVGKQDLETTPANIDINTTGITTVQYGTLNVTQLTAGQFLMPFIENNGDNAINLHFAMRLGER